MIGLRGPSHFEQIAGGIAAYCRDTGRIQIRGGFAAEQATRSEEHRSIFHALLAEVDAVITTCATPAVVGPFQERGTPTVMVSGRASCPQFPSVLPDDARIGAMGAEFLLGRGLQEFAFLGFGGFVYSERRRAAFASRLGREGHPTRAHEIDGIWHALTMDAHLDKRTQLRAWIAGLPKPCGVFCANDVIASMLLREALTAGVAIPEELAVLGVDNEPSHHSLPPLELSSIPLDSHGQGYEAARLVDLLMGGGRPPAEPVWIAPGPVVARASTDIAFASDPTVRRALAVMYGRFREPLRVTEVARACHVSRRLLEVRFRETLHRSPREELERIRLHEARRLLRHGDRNLDEVAELAGFSHAGVLIGRFRALFGETPGKFRARVGVSERPAGHGPGQAGKRVG